MPEASVRAGSAGDRVELGSAVLTYLYLTPRTPHLILQDSVLARKAILLFGRNLWVHTQNTD